MCNTDLHTHNYNKCKCVLCLLSVLVMLIYWAKLLTTVRINTDVLLVASKEVALQTNAEKIKYVVMSRDEIAG